MVCAVSARQASMLLARNFKNFTDAEDRRLRLAGVLAKKRVKRVARRYKKAEVDRAAAAQKKIAAAADLLKSNALAADALLRSQALDAALIAAKKLPSWKQNEKREDVKKGPFSAGEKKRIMRAVVSYARRWKFSTKNFDWLLDIETRGHFMVISAAALPNRKYGAVYTRLRRVQRQKMAKAKEAKVARRAALVEKKKAAAVAAAAVAAAAP